MCIRDRVYTTRPDTLFGATYMVLSPEHELVRKWLESGALKNAAEVTAYQKAAASKSDLERTELNKEKTGVRLDGVRGVNPVNGREIPIFISDYAVSYTHLDVYKRQVSYWTNWSSRPSSSSTPRRARVWPGTCTG